MTVGQTQPDQPKSPPVRRRRQVLLSQGTSAVPATLLAEHVRRGAAIRRLLRLILIGFFVAVMITEPPIQHAATCWILVGGYLAWTLGLDLVNRRAGDRTLGLVWLGLFVDMAVVATLTLITDASAAVSWTPYLMINGFFLIPVMAAAQLNPWVGVIIVVPTVALYLISGLVTRRVDDDPVPYLLLSSLVLAAVGLGAVLLSRLQRSRVEAIARLLDERNALLGELVTLQDRERRELAEVLHDGALQYVLAARQELDDAVAGDQEAAERIDRALVESGRLLRSTTSQLHPAVLDAAGLRSALTELITTTAARGRFVVDLDAADWDGGPTAVDELLLSTARELLTNTVKHARARMVRVELRRMETGALLIVTDDGVGLAESVVDTRLRAGHLGLASRRIRIEAAGGTLAFLPVQPHGTRVEVRVPLAGRAG